MLSAHLYRGKSLHPVLQSGEKVYSSVEIFDDVVLQPWWKRLFKRPVSVVEPFVNITWTLFSLEKGQSILAEVRPVGSYLPFRSLDQYRVWLDEQIKGVSGKKTECPSDKSDKDWPNSVFCKQYLFEINERKELFNLFDWFRNFEMLNFFIFNVDAKLENCMHQLQQGYMGNSFDLEGLVETVNSFIYCSSLGDNLIIESPRHDIIERFLSIHHIPSVSVNTHPLEKHGKTERSLWLGKRRLLP